MKNRVCELLGIRIPIIQAGMIWCSGWRLASAVSNAGGLGIIGAGSMYPEVLREHIRKCKAATSAPFGINVPLLYPNIDEHMNIIAEEGVKVVFTSAGNPATWTGFLKNTWHNCSACDIQSQICKKSRGCRCGCDCCRRV
jgi:enoyl-[acyl-carrier protein] reductase II